MIDDQSDPGAWKDALRFPSAIRQLPDAIADTCQPGPVAAGNLGAANAESVAAPLSDQSVAHAAANTSKVDE